MPPELFECVPSETLYPLYTVQVHVVLPTTGRQPGGPPTLCLLFDKTAIRRLAGNAARMRTNEGVIFRE